MNSKRLLTWVAGFTLGCTSLWAQSISPFITIDQFGYRPDAPKTAVIRDPMIGSDATVHFVPGATYRIMDANSGLTVLEAAPTVYSSGATDAASGDKIWWLDFSAVTAPGQYYVLDVSNNVKSYNFKIATDIYNDVLKHAVRMFYYQRAGYEKKAAFAGVGWADAASHVGPLQDANCRSIFAKNDASTERDLHGGWFDAGDYNKYTSWTGSYVETMLAAYRDRPRAFTDDYGIPESGNGTADLVDEAKWGMDFLLRMQNPDGSMLSIVGLAGLSPPSSTKGASYYGPANTNATLSSARAFAIGASVFQQLGQKTYAQQLSDAALKAWTWAEAHPDSIFHNNVQGTTSEGLGAGDQENENTFSRLEMLTGAAFRMYELTGDAKYLAVFEANYTNFPLIAWGNFMDQYRSSQNLIILDYIKLGKGDASIRAALQNALIVAFNKSPDFAGKLGADGYRSFIMVYNWGSNKYKSDYGLLFERWADQNLEAGKSSTYHAVAEDYLHYIHGVNPFSMVYLTGMNAYGATKSITQIYHTWYQHGSAQWDETGVSTFGPAPGYLSGGPNSSYKLDGCCEANTCGSTVNNAHCKDVTLPVGEPAAKMYRDINNGWPSNSWEITEPSDGYQVSYISLLSRFVEEKGTLPGESLRNKQNAHGINTELAIQGHTLSVPGSPVSGMIQLFDLKSHCVLRINSSTQAQRVDVSHLAVGVYFAQTPWSNVPQRVVKR